MTKARSRKDRGCLLQNMYSVSMDWPAPFSMPLSPSLRYRGMGPGRGSVGRGKAGCCDWHGTGAVTLERVRSSRNSFGTQGRGHVMDVAADGLTIVVALRRFSKGFAEGKGGLGHHELAHATRLGSDALARCRRLFYLTRAGIERSCSRTAVTSPAPL